MEVDYGIYAKGTTPALAPQKMTVEEEARGLARKIKASHGGERLHNVGLVSSEIKTLERNQANGYGGWEFRLAVLKRTLQLVGGI
jgi:hypothetical protein